MARYFCINCTVLLLVSFCSAGITVSAPVSGTTVSSPVHVVATASTDLYAMKIYVDNTAVYSIAGYKIDTYLSMAAGSHYLVVQGWSSSGAIYKSPLSITVASSSITITSPTAGSTVASPVHIVATGPNDVTTMQVYVDNVLKYQVSGRSVDTYLSMATGTRYIVAQGWTSSGGILKTPVTVSVSTSTSSPPSGSYTYQNIDQMSGWESCGACAGINGSGPVGTYWMKQFVASPSLDGASAQFYLGGTAWADALWWKQLGANAGASHFVYDLYFYVNFPGNAQALEFDVNQSVNSRKYIFGTQCNVAAGQWDVWDTANAQWVHTGIGCSAPAAYQWHHLVLEFQRMSNGQTYFVAVTLNGSKKYINRYYWSKPVSASELNVAFQMDLKGSGAGYSTWLDKVKLTVW